MTNFFDDMDGFIVINETDAHIVQSRFGNSVIGITPDDIEALNNGKVLYFTDGEYGTYIKLSNQKTLSKTQIEMLEYLIKRKESED